jgi:hypothetical protein
MRQRFLTAYDYGTGGVWQWITADSAEQIASKYPQLTVVNEIPKWLDERTKANLRSYDIDDEPEGVLRSISQSNW